ncbi:MAG: DNA-binding response regulator [Actinobacteria bacterium]|nr:DNA-binding response regulator [Actinomycetota bacterium]
MASGHEHSTGDSPVELIGVYSDDRDVRRSVMLALGSRPAKDVPAVQCVEFATAPALMRALDRGVDGRKLSVVVLDGEAVPAGGMGIARQIKDEIFNAPPVVLIVARAQDGWLAAWSRADSVLAQPLDPRAMAAAVAEQLRRKAARSSVTVA